ncbi:thioesterase domain-containing protein [Streptomyces lasalocidi]
MASQGIAAGAGAPVPDAVMAESVTDAPSVRSRLMRPPARGVGRDPARRGPRPGGAVDGLRHPRRGGCCGRGFAELGFDSLTATWLNQRLAIVTGLDLPRALVVDQPTPYAVAKHLAERLAELDGLEPPPAAPAVPATPSHVPATPARPAADPLPDLFAQACAQGQVRDGLDLLAVAARLRVSAGPPPMREPVRFSQGHGGRTLVCIPSVVAPSNVYQYSRMAVALRAGHDMTVVPLTGYADGEPLPTTRADLVTAVAEAVRGSVRGPYVLIGYSSGGWIAHEAADRLNALDAGPESLVLLDSHVPGSAGLAEIQFGLLGDAYAEWTATQPLRGAELTAMAHHLQMFEDWAPADIGVPTLLLRATERMDGPRSRRRAVAGPVGTRPRRRGRARQPPEHGRRPCRDHRHGDQRLAGPAARAAPASRPDHEGSVMSEAASEVDLLSRNFTQNPYLTYRSMREQGGAERLIIKTLGAGLHAWLVTGYEDARCGCWPIRGCPRTRPPWAGRSRCTRSRRARAAARSARRACCSATRRTTRGCGACSARRSPCAAWRACGRGSRRSPRRCSTR